MTCLEPQANKDPQVYITASAYKGCLQKYHRHQDGCQVGQAALSSKAACRGSTPGRLCARFWVRSSREVQCSQSLSNQGIKTASCSLGCVGAGAVCAPGQGA
eukprot:scaffold317872_cov14-Tisochrysis_lutea.AAC.1